MKIYLYLYNRNQSEMSITQRSYYIGINKQMYLAGDQLFTPPPVFTGIASVITFIAKGSKINC